MKTLGAAVRMGSFEAMKRRLRLASPALLVFLACSSLTSFSATATPSPQPVAFLSAAPLSSSGASRTSGTAAGNARKGCFHTALGIAKPMALTRARPLHRLVLAGGVACSAGGGEGGSAGGEEGVLRGASVLPLPAFDQWMQDKVPPGPLMVTLRPALALAGTASAPVHAKLPEGAGRFGTVTCDVVDFRKLLPCSSHCLLATSSRALTWPVQ